jgi:hypothetical protein
MESKHVPTSYRKAENIWLSLLFNYVGLQEVGFLVHKLMNTIFFNI